MKANTRSRSKRKPAGSRLQAWRKLAVARMERSRAATLRFLARLPESAILQPRTQGNWSVKDTFAHFVAWEEEGVERLELIARGQGHRVHFYQDMREADRFNARAVRRARRWSWKELLRRAARVRRRLIVALQRVPLESLEDPSQQYTVTAWLPEFAWTHEQSHLARIRDWWTKRQ